MDMDPTTARSFWRALMDNASGLIVDAHALLAGGSFGRARSLTILAQEELGKALWIYEVFEQAWTTGSREARRVPRLTVDGRRHAVKYMEAFVFGQELAAFWGDYEDVDLPEDQSTEGWGAWFAKNRDDAEAAGRRANEAKMAGFYVDLDVAGQMVLSPADISAGTIAADLQTAAQVVEMLLIKDHSRMKLEAQTPYDSTHKQQHRLLPISHPEDWREASDEFRRGEFLEGSGDGMSSPHAP
jgi:AbiV family abortive infection protein